MADANRPNSVTCWQCRHFQTSWDKNFPYLCKSLNFKSKLLPSIEVKQSSGKDCLSFQAKLQRS
ncbi:MAG: uracil-DNA glycosylase [Gammaproteobacteria bacterium TMED92]|nr:MAG: uracil-DNA glycosylase [Gammaproteobacteria bacterium TMED92]